MPVVALVGAAGVGGALGAAARHLRCGSGLRPRAGGWNGDSTIDTIHDIKQHITTPTINNDNEPPISAHFLLTSLHNQLHSESDIIFLFPEWDNTIDKPQHDIICPAPAHTPTF